jgi:rare lipoprotein A
MQLRNKCLLIVPALLVASCGGFGGRDDRPVPVPVQPAERAVPDVPVRLGEPYVIGGQRYVPVDQTDYDEVGYASWYGAELAGNPTANGEDFNPAWISAAHRTLPMPSYVEVTRLDTGRTILVRVNDRGPADQRRLIDLSAGAAEQLGITDMGTVPVRVRRTNPVDAERIALRTGRAVPVRLDTPDSLLVILRERAARLPVPANAAPVRVTRSPQVPAAPPARRPAPVEQVSPSGTGFVVQLGAFSSRARADALAQRLGATVATSGSLHRVRLGPFATEGEAEAALAQTRQRGHPGGVVVRDR